MLLTIGAQKGEAVYHDASTLSPERWYAHPDCLKEPKAFAPFSTGMHTQPDLRL